ncbi:hypothetical protein GF338_06760, partial [candidate division WOR-3 bacterium]|nr:hypothetical protein [candidate division WOR-3 bacterium]
MDAFKGKLTQGFSRAVKDLGIALGDFFFPGVCLVCGEDAQSLPLCKECLDKLQPVDEVYTREDLRIRAWARFTYPLDKLVYAFKYNHHRGLARFFASRLAGTIDSDKDYNSADGLVPIPLHPVKKWLRTYNQSELISRALSRQTGIPVFSLLKRNRMTRTQIRLDEDARRRNVAGAFS